MSGLIGSGKDYLAEKLGYTCWGFADPMYEIAEYYFKTRDKSLPGMREFLQTIGQWGWGCVNDQYPLTTVRANTIAEIRRNGRNMTKNFHWVNWDLYGLPGFWVNILFQRVRELRAKEGYDPTLAKMIAITNVRFAPEYEQAKANDFEHFLILCSEETRRERALAKGSPLKPSQDNDTSEQLARSLATTLPDESIIWNDHRPMPDGKHYRTTEDFELYLRYGIRTVTSEGDPTMHKDGVFTVDGKPVVRNGRKLYSSHPEPGETNGIYTVTEVKQSSSVFYP